MLYKAKIVVLIKFIILTIVVTSCAEYTQEPSTHTSATIEQPTTLNLLSQEAQSGCTTSNCWNAIVPGLTTLLEAQTLLETQYGQTNIIIDEHYISWETNSMNGSSSGWLVSNQEDIVSNVVVNFPSGQLTTTDVIDQIGEPSYVLVVMSFPPEVQCIGSSIFYPSMGIVIQLHPEDASIGVYPSQSISTITFMAVKQSENWEPADAIMITWQGFREYCNLIENIP